MEIRGTVVVDIEDSAVFEALQRIIARSQQDCWLEEGKDGTTRVMTEGHTSHRFDYEVKDATKDFVRTLRAAQALSNALREFRKAIGKP